MRPMNASRPLLLALLLGSSAAFAQTQPAPNNDQTLIERTVVRNRLYEVDKRFELSPTFGLTLVNRLTQHWNLNLGAAYNFHETLAFEVRGGYAISRHTGLADQIGQAFLRRNPNPPQGERTVTDDLENLWEMKANGAAGVRWAPLYGKLGLMAEVPVHFQAYLWAGGGAGMFERESIVQCLVTPNRGEGTCGADGSGWQRESRVSWLASGAAGLRFFTHSGGGLKVEVRNYVWPDRFLEDINRAQAEAGAENGTYSNNPGLSQIVLVDLGYSFIF